MASVYIHRHINRSSTHPERIYESDSCLLKINQKLYNIYIYTYNICIYNIYTNITYPHLHPLLRISSGPSTACAQLLPYFLPMSPQSCCARLEMPPVLPPRGAQAWTRMPPEPRAANSSSLLLNFSIEIMSFSIEMDEHGDLPSFPDHP